MSVTESVKDILSTSIFVEAPPDRMDEDDSLRDVFGLDSLGFLELRIQCQDRFSVTISSADFTPENFATIRTVVGLVDRLQDASVGAGAGAPADRS
jgi:acyl carrier protein